MLRKLLIAGAILTATSGAALAVDHEVFIEEGAFFPQTTYVQPGDTLTFTNTEAVSRRVIGDRFGFISPQLAQNESWTLEIEADMKNDFFARSFSNGSSDNTNYGEGTNTAEDYADTIEGGVAMRGTLSFQAPPSETN